MDCSLPGSSVHGVFQARMLEWAAISFSRRSSQPRDQTHVSRIDRPLSHLGSPESTLLDSNRIVKWLSQHPAKATSVLRLYRAHDGWG